MALLNMGFTWQNNQGSRSPDEIVAYADPVYDAPGNGVVQAQHTEYLQIDGVRAYV